MGRDRVWREAIERGGITLDPVPFPRRDAARYWHAAAKSLRTITVCPSNNVCEEVRAGIKSASSLADEPVSVACYPSRTRFDPESGTGNCKNFDAIQAAIKMGLPPGPSVCPHCEFNNGCEY